jgi:uncharacterized cysteine cluster protein YcgN (CxxCxxCC family)
MTGSSSETETAAEEEPFWRWKRLVEMTSAEWESLCDGCGKCCLLKLEDPDTAEIAFTDVACKLLDLGTCRCKNYPERKRVVSDCVVLHADTIRQLRWMPSTCAYRLLSEGQDLPWWHPLVSGDPQTVHQAGVSVRGRAVCETRVEDAELEDHIVDWPA